MKPEGNFHFGIQPGTTLVVSDIPVDRTTPIESGINILTADVRN